MRVSYKVTFTGRQTTSVVFSTIGEAMAYKIQLPNPTMARVVKMEFGDESSTGERGSPRFRGADRRKGSGSVGPKGPAEERSQ